MFIFISTLTFAAPFLVCDPQETVAFYVVELDGQEYQTAAEEDGSIKWDLANVDVGTHTIRLMAGNAAGDWSDWSVPFVFTLEPPVPPPPPPPNVPTGIQLSIN